MTRDAVAEGLNRFVTETIDAAYEEVDVTAVVAGRTTGGGRALSRVLKNNRLLEEHVVRPLLSEYERETMAGFEVVIDYAANPDDDFADYRDDVLAHDAYVTALRDDLPADRRAEVLDALADRHRRLGEAAVPLVAADENEFWAAVEATFEADEIRSLVEEHFAFTTPLREYPDAFVFDTELDLGDVLNGPLAAAAPTIRLEFTDEVRRVMSRAEETTIQRTLRDIDRRYA